MSKNIGKIIIFLLVVFLMVYFIGKAPKADNLNPTDRVPSTEDEIKPADNQEKNKNEEGAYGIIKGIKKFASKEEFNDFIEAGLSKSDFWYSGGRGISMEMMAEDTVSFAHVTGESKATTTPERISETNVQVFGIDEPDILKTNGKEIYFSSDFFQLFEPQFESQSVSSSGIAIAPDYYPRQTGEIKILSAFPPESLKKEAQIDKTGNLLLSNNHLIVFANQEIISYDISKPANPKKEWLIEIGDKSSLADARLYDEKIYLITKTWVNSPTPCPIRPLMVSGKNIEILCTDIYHPITPTLTDITFTAMVINPGTGEVSSKTSFTGSSGSSIIYMSENSIYVTHTYYGDILDFFSDFVKNEAKDLFPTWFQDKLTNLKGYDISLSAKITELDTILEQYYSSLNNDETLRINNEISNRMYDYYKKHKRELERTGITKIGLNNLEVKALGDVPGFPKDQFSLDEYENNLRIAITVGENVSGLYRFGLGWNSQNSTNDVYVLDNDMKIIGSLTDLGLNEKIYSSRFIGEKGYLVTFRQTDPFFVLDLSKPTKPKLSGELKIPGYSSYLHPIDNNNILGVGQEGSQVKISLFDVSSPSYPKEASKYILDEYWSEVLSTHHAFLLDKKHQVFFMPGSRGGYIFSYQDNKISLKRAVSDISAKRAIYLDDYMYIIGSDKIIVLDENNWEEIKELVF